MGAFGCSGGVKTHRFAHAAEAGSHKPRVGGGGHGAVERLLGCATRSNSLPDEGRVNARRSVLGGIDAMHEAIRRPNEAQPAKSARLPTVVSSSSAVGCVADAHWGSVRSHQHSTHPACVGVDDGADKQVLARRTVSKSLGDGHQPPRTSKSPQRRRVVLWRGALSDADGPEDDG